MNRRSWKSQVMSEAQRRDKLLGRPEGTALDHAREVAAECCRMARTAADIDLRLAATDDMLALARRDVPIYGLREASPHIAQWLRTIADDPWQKPMDRIRAAQFTLAGSVLGWWPVPLWLPFTLEISP